MTDTTVLTDDELRRHGIGEPAIALRRRKASATTTRHAEATKPPTPSPTRIAGETPSRRACTSGTGHRGIETWVQGPTFCPDCEPRHACAKHSGLATITTSSGWMPECVTLTLPWSCMASDNERHTRIGAHSKRYVAARQRAHDLVAEQWGERSPFAGRVALHVVFFPPNAARRDIANFAKLIGDALSGVAYVDDAQIDRLVMERMAPDVDRPRAEITVEELIR